MISENFRLFFSLQGNSKDAKLQVSEFLTIDESYQVVAIGVQECSIQDEDFISMMHKHVGLGFEMVAMQSLWQIKLVFLVFFIFFLNSV